MLNVEISKTQVKPFLLQVHPTPLCLILALSVVRQVYICLAKSRSLMVTIECSRTSVIKILVILN